VGDIDSVVNAAGEGRGPAPGPVSARGRASYERLDLRVRAPMKALGPDGPGGRVALVSVGAFMLKHASRIALRCFRRFRARRDHGFHATLVEEVARELYGDLLGASIWAMIVSDAADHFKPGGFGEALLQALPPDNPVRIVVTAHSAGSIWACRMLQAIARSGRPVEVDLVLLAPAVRLDLFAETIDAAEGNIGRCRMFTMSEALERKDAVLGHDRGYIYPSSLLYLVSGLFEDQGGKAFPDAPLLGMQRFAAAPWLDDPVQLAAASRAAAFFQKPGHGIVYSPVAGTTVSDTHSGFASEPLTLASAKALFEAAAP
jgi:hypothetical protein